MCSMRPAICLGMQPAHLLLAAGGAVWLGVSAWARLPVGALAILLPPIVVVAVAAVAVAAPTIAAPAGDLTVALWVVAAAIGHVPLRARPKLRLRASTQRRLSARSQTHLLHVVHPHSSSSMQTSQGLMQPGA